VEKGKGEKKCPSFHRMTGIVSQRRQKEEEKTGSFNLLFLVQVFTTLSGYIHAEYDEQTKNHKSKKDRFHISLKKDHSY
jgi:hypothetical protein